MLRPRSAHRLLGAALRSRSNREFYNCIAPIYDDVFTHHLGDAEVMLDRLQAHLGARAAPARIVDLGCGTGLLAHRLAAKGHKTFGIDISLASLRVLRDKAPTAWAVQGTADALPLANSSVDAVLCLGVWRHLDDPEACMAEITRALKPGGLLIIGYFPPAIGGLIDLPDDPIRRVFARAYEAATRLRGFADHTGDGLEAEALRLARRHLEGATTIPSGKRHRLIVALIPGTRTAAPARNRSTAT